MVTSQDSRDRVKVLREDLEVAQAELSQVRQELVTLAPPPGPYFGGADWPEMGRLEDIDIRIQEEIEAIKTRIRRLAGGTDD
jgi:hypothetical protein